MPNYTKQQLLNMNMNRAYGFNWILNLDTIAETEEAILYPTEQVGLHSGRLYVALPANMVITELIIKQYKLDL